MAISRGTAGEDRYCQRQVVEMSLTCNLKAIAACCWNLKLGTSRSRATWKLLLTCCQTIVYFWGVFLF